jgi:hypothetical protein
MRSLVLRSIHLTNPNGYALAETARCSLKPPICPIRITHRIVEAGLVVEVVKVGADDLTVLHSNARFIDKERHTAGRINSIIWAINGAGSRLEDFDTFA